MTRGYPGKPIVLAEAARFLVEGGKSLPSGRVRRFLLHNPFRARLLLERTRFFLLFPWLPLWFGSAGEYCRFDSYDPTWRSAFNPSTYTWSFLVNARQMLMFVTWHSPTDAPRPPPSQSQISWSTRDSLTIVVLLISVPRIRSPTVPLVL